MGELTTFNFEGQAVRTVFIGEEPWWVGKDVCDCLEIVGYRRALSEQDADERTGVRIPYAPVTSGDNEGMSIKVDTPGGPQEMICVNEPGVYRLIFSSRKPAAERFKRWLAHDVLPTLHRTGRYAMPGSDGALLEPEDERLWNARIMMYLKLFGKNGARWMLEQSPYPLPPGAVAAGPRIGVAREDGPTCLAYLLTFVPDPLGVSMGELIERAMRDRELRKELRALGVLVGPPGWDGHVAIPYDHPALAAIFEGTAWEGGWRDALLSLPFAKRSDKQFKFGDARPRRAVVLPLRDVAME